MIAEAGGELPTVLVIDDELGPRESIRILLKKQYEVLCAESVDEGLALMQERRPDLIVLDIAMPDKSGIEGLREIRALDTNTSVVMLTGFGALETAQQAMRLGANDYLNKPFDTNEMRQVAQKYTQRTRMERKRRNMLEQLGEVNTRLLDDLATNEQLASVGRSSAEFAHDLRNPLMIISGYTELLAKQLDRAKDMMGETYDQASDYLDVIEQNVGRCQELSRMWQQFGKMGNLSELLPLEATDLMNEVVSSIEPLASTKNVKVDYILQPENACIRGSRPQLIRAIHNVLANAVQAVPAETGWVRIGAREDGDCLRITVKDNGCGMPPDVLERIFEPYFTTKGEDKGTGLGMVITRKIVEEHQGTIDVESGVGQGTTMTIALPLCRESVAAGG